MNKPCLLVVFFLTISSIHIRSQTLRKIKSFSDTEIKYQFFTPAEEVESIDIRDLSIKVDLNETEFPRRMFKDNEDIRIYLLRKGFAILNKPEIAKKAEIRAQSEAESKLLGHWANTPQDLPDKAAYFFNENSWGKGIKYIFSFLLSLGVFRWIGRQTFFNKRVNLILIGLSSVGKSALWKYLLDPDVNPAEILTLDPSRSPNVQKINRVIPIGKYEVIPQYIDIPGTNYTEMFEALYPQGLWDKVVRFFVGNRKNVIIYLLSPTRKNGYIKDENGRFSKRLEGSIIDELFINEQLGHMKGLLREYLLSQCPIHVRL